MKKLVGLLLVATMFSCSNSTEAYEEVEELKYIKVEEVSDDEVIRFGRLYYIYVDDMKYLLIQEVDGGMVMRNVTLDKHQLTR